MAQGTTNIQNRRRDGRRSCLLVLTDMAFAVLGFFAAVALAGTTGPGASRHAGGFLADAGERLDTLAQLAADITSADLGPAIIPALWAFLATGLGITLHFFSLYEQRRWFRPPGVFFPVLEAVAVFHGLLMALLFACGVAGRVPPGLLFTQLATTTLAVAAGRVAFRRGWNALRTRVGVDLAGVAVVGTDAFSRSLAERIQNTPGAGYRLRGLVAVDDMDAAGDPAPARGPLSESRLPKSPAPEILGSTTELAAIIESERIAELFVAGQSLSREDVMDILALTEPMGITVRVANAQLAIIPSRVALRADVHGGIPIVDFSPGRPGIVARAITRALDMAVASFCLAVLAPAAAVISCLVKWDSRGPVLFHQRRLTAGRRPFRCLKFRSMCAEADAMRGDLAHLNEKQGAMFKLRGDPRVTRVGRVLRRWSLDETPQLVNVLLGDMSLVGPRPPTEDEVAEYEPRHFHRFTGKAGLTGLWQTSGRHDIGFENMVLLDVFYLRNRSLVLDWRILLRTLSTVLRGSGAA